MNALHPNSEFHGRANCKYCCQQQQKKCYLTLNPLLCIRSQYPNIITCHHWAAESATEKKKYDFKGNKNNPTKPQPRPFTFSADMAWPSTSALPLPLFRG